MNEQVTGAQIKAHQQETAKIVKSIADQMKLRQWAAEQALKCLPCSQEDLRAAANFFYDFVTKQD